ncbi:MAG: M48 family metalloprotease [Nitrospinaceae bacterium]
MKILPSAKNLPILLALIFLAACAGPQKRCDYPLTGECARAQKVWQEAIDTIVTANFPEEWGRYLAVIWEDDFDNAWVVRGHEINITRNFLNKMNRIQILCVAAHELAHLKLGHYYSRMGIIIVDQPVKDKSGKHSLESGHYGENIHMDIPRGFGELQEEEADQLAIRYVEGARLPKRYYLDLLRVLLASGSDAETDLADRIEHIRRTYNIR